MGKHRQSQERLGDNKEHLQKNIEIVIDTTPVDPSGKLVKSL